jgi:peptidyl-prolyl cis-trans isomerase D
MLKLRRDDPWFRIASGVFLILVCVSMVITLIPGMTGTTTDPTVGKVVAEVGNQEITTTELQQGLQNLTRTGRVPAEMVSSYSSQVLDQLVMEKAIQQEAERLGIHVTAAQLQQRLRQIPDLFPNGKFVGKEQYENLVYERTGDSVSEFERKFHSALLNEQLRKMVTDSIIVSPEEVRNELRAENESFVLQYVYLDPESLKKEIATPDPLVEAYFEKNKNRYQIEEKRAGKVLLLQKADLEKSVTPSDADIKKYYQDHLESYRVEERVAVSHILIKASTPDTAGVEKARAKAEALAKQLASGADFAALATKNSEDAASAAKGGDLGYIVKGQTVPGFEMMAFALQPGTISAPVQTEFGFHIIKVREHEQAHVRSLDEVRSEIEAALRAERVQTELNTKAEAAAAEWRKTPSDAQRIAEKYNGTIVDVHGITRTETIAAVPGSGAVVQEFFSIEKGWVGKVTAVSTGVAVPMLTDILGSRQAKFEEVKDRVRTDYLNEQARSLAQIQMQSLAQALEKQEKKDIAAAAKAQKLVVKTTPPLNRTGNIEGVGPMSALVPALKSLKPGDFGGPVSAGAGQIVFQVVSRTAPPDDILALQKKPVEDRLRTEKQNMAYRAFEEALKKRLTDSGDLVIHKDVLDQLGATAGLPLPASM